MVNKRVSVEQVVHKLRTLPPFRAETYLKNKLMRNGIEGFIVLKQSPNNLEE